MTHFDFEKRYYCPKCNRMVKVLHEHTTKLMEEPPAGSPYRKPPRLPPGWSALSIDQIEAILRTNEGECE